MGSGGLIKQLMGRLITRAMNAEMSHHLGYEHGQVHLTAARATVAT